MRARASGYQQRQRYYHHYIIRRIGCSGSGSSSLARALIDLVSRLVSCGRPLTHFLSLSLSLHLCPSLSVRMSVRLPVRLSLSIDCSISPNVDPSLTPSLSFPLAVDHALSVSLPPLPGRDTYGRSPPPSIRCPSSVLHNVDTRPPRANVI